jgi:hypothetical protein
MFLVAEEIPGFEIRGLFRTTGATLWNVISQEGKTNLPR